ncbi:MAG: oxygen-independent coproporphyrinogen III oxidase [Bacteroidetes bacterium 46-16]|nr:MAG: oxygen-independent coproporphyrinogen III oxidase [Bacteroidetes bacterium 46-16]
MLQQELLNKYNVPVPRYTSYPTVPYWDGAIDADRWELNFQEQFRKGNGQGISLYLHLPFCESLCTYCGCNKKITTNHNVEQPYIAAILKEWELYREMMHEKPLLRELHIGGGTPTFFSPQHLEQLVLGIIDNCVLHPEYEFGIEGHPNNTTAEQLEALYKLGFRRISYGVQDNDPIVQQAINRIQAFEQVQAAMENARDAGFTSVNFDLIYGLPFQAKDSIERTIMQSISLRPDRVAFYSYAHVPWTSRGQRLFDERNLPDAQLKMELYRTGKELFEQHGYRDIGMDHFALPGDELYKAQQEQRLHRNFMGYTTQRSAILLGLGVSAISDTGNAFAQNEKTLHEYYRQVERGLPAVHRGYFLDEEDKHFRRYILDVMCMGKTGFAAQDMHILEEYSFPQLEEMEADGLLHFDHEGLRVTDIGHSFLRNICSAFDLHLQRKQCMKEQAFSKAV